MGRLNGPEQVSLMNTGGFVEDDGDTKAFGLLEMGAAAVIFAALMIFASGGE